MQVKTLTGLASASTNSMGSNGAETEAAWWASAAIFQRGVPLSKASRLPTGIGRDSVVTTMA